MVKSITSAVFWVVFVFLCVQLSAQIGKNDLFGFQYKGQDIDETLFALVALATVFGALLGVVYEYLAKTESNEPWWRSMWVAFSSRRFGLSLLATPLIVFYVFDQVYAKVDAGVILFCIQSGFFWEKTLGLVSGVKAPAPPAPQPKGTDKAAA